MGKKIYFITQAKGGSGKSVLAFMLAEKYKEAVLLDLDDATTTTTKQLAYRKPIKVSFLDPSTKRIDRVLSMGYLRVLLKQTGNYSLRILARASQNNCPNTLQLME